jgi:hypothetical protein
MDLLPLYVDDICRNETVSFIEEHINGCDTCQMELDSLKEDIAVFPSEKNDIKRIENLSKDIKKRTLDSYFKGLMISSLIFAIGAFVSYQRADVYLLEDGTLVEPFYLIPLGYLAGLVFFISAVVNLIRRKR